MPGYRNRASGRTRWVALLLVVAALLVNRQPLLELLDLGVVAPTRSDGFFGITSAADLPAAPLGEPAAMLPVHMVERIMDPMSHREATPDQSVGVPDQSVGVIDKEVSPPMVTLILYGGKSRRALVEGVIVGVGDVTRVGKVIAIEPAAVLVRSKTGQSHALRLGDVAEQSAEESK